MHSTNRLLKFRASITPPRAASPVKALHQLVHRLFTTSASGAGQRRGSGYDAAVREERTPPQSLGERFGLPALRWVKTQLIPPQRIAKSPAFDRRRCAVRRNTQRA